MTMKFLLPCSLALFGSVLLSGCGGGGGSSSSSTATSAGKSSLTLKIVWPVPTNSKLIPVDSKSITAILTDANGNSLGKQTVAKPATGNSTVVSFSGLTAEAVTLTASAYPNTDGTGVAQAIGSSSTTLVSGQVSNVTVTMADTITSISILVNGQAANSTNTQLAVGSTAQLTESALDAKGEVVLTSPSTIVWSSANSADFSVSSTGLVKAVAATSTPVAISVKETESGVSNSVSFGQPAATTGSGSQPVTMFGSSNHFVYAWGKGGITEYSEGSTGALVPLSPSFIAVTGTLQKGQQSVWVAGNYVYALLNNGSSTFNLVCYNIQENGQLKQVLGPVQMPATTIGTLTGDQSGTYIYVPGQSNIAEFQVNQGTSTTLIGTFALPIAEGGSTVFPTGAIAPVGNYIVAGGSSYSGSTASPEIATCAIGGDGKLLPTEYQQLQSTIQAVQIIQSPQSGYFYVVGTQYPGFASQHAVVELYAIDSESGSITDDGVANFVQNGNDFMSLSGQTFTGGLMTSEFPGANQVVLYTVGSNGQVTPTIPAGQLPTTNGFNDTFTVGVYLQGGETPRLYVPDYLSNEISQFSISSSNTLSPLSPPTVSD